MSERTDLALPGSVSETGLDLPANLTFDEWQATGRTLGRIGRACQWWIGDWLNYGERAYGEKYAQAMEATGLELQTLTNIAWVAAHVEISRRREILSFTHHVEVAALEPSEQDHWLDSAAENSAPQQPEAASDGEPASGTEAEGSRICRCSRWR